MPKKKRKGPRPEDLPEFGMAQSRAAGMAEVQREIDETIRLARGAIGQLSNAKGELRHGGNSGGAALSNLTAAVQLAQQLFG
jgi:hypothetical protein